MATTSTSSNINSNEGESQQPEIEKLMQEICEKEPIQLEQRVESLREVDKKIMELMNIVTEVILSLEKDKPMSKAKMEDLYKRYELKLDEIQRGIGEQLNYMEQVCIGAEHQGSNFYVRKMAELGGSRMNLLRAQLGEIREGLYNNGSKEYCETSSDKRGEAIRRNE